MSEIRVRPRQVLLLVIIFGCILWLVHRRSSNCTTNKSIYMSHFDDGAVLPTIYAITPTYSRPEQKAELTRLSHVFMLVPNLHWVIVEDENSTTTLVKNLLDKAGLSKRSTLLNFKTPAQFKLKRKDPNWIKPRGVEQRNLALHWIRSNANRELQSIVFFMDDDNTYSIELFQEMAKIEPGRVGVWPVGLVGGLKVEKPLVDSNHKVVGFNAVWRPDRPFPIDMAAFALSTDLLFKYEKAVFSYEVQRGFQESELLRHLTTMEELQPLASYCTKVNVWHTRTEKTKLGEEDKLIKKGESSNNGIEV